MRKKLAFLTTTMVISTTCGLAANPFTDVPTDSWAYQSVVKLADAGVIQGVDGTYFQGNRNITRYEAAEMTAKAMVHMDSASVEQRAVINKLADEYADELHMLGIRVSNLEQKVGNVNITGDIRFRYINQNNTTSTSNDGVTGDASWSYRARLRANVTINDTTSALVGFSTNNQTFINSTAAAAEDTGASPGIYNDDAYVQHNFSKNLTVKAGRWDEYILGNAYGYQYGDVFDGAQAEYDNGKIALTAGYGIFKEGATGENDLLGVSTGYGEIEGYLGNKAKVGIYYNSFHGNNSPLKSLLGAYGKMDMGSKWHALVDFQDITHDAATAGTNDNSRVWAGVLTYGASSFSKPHSWDAWIEYVNADAHSLYGSTDTWRNNNLLDNVASWGIGFDYTLMNNTKLQFFQTFGSKAKNSSISYDPKEETRVEVMFVF
ncbi:putative porin [Megasphaera sueciensis]|uniref:putative porin n=1 Tax=Megasphaera sueciensis TaxID=349094 RepID=UPI003D05F49A